MSEQVFLVNPRKKARKARKVRKTAKRRVHRNPGELMFVNPSRRRRAKKSSHKKSFRRSYRRNPGRAGGLPSGLKQLLPLAAVAAAGAVTVRTVNALVLKDKDTGYMGYAGMAAISTAALFSKKWTGKWGVAFALGGFVATVDRVLREQVMPRVMPNVALSGLGGVEPYPAIEGFGQPMLPENIEGVGNFETVPGMGY